MIQVRNVPEKLHRELTRRARKRGQTLTDYIQEILEREVSTPPQEDVWARIASREPIEFDKPVWQIIREMREAGEP